MNRKGFTPPLVKGSGFTIIELVIVIVIIGILALGVYFSLSSTNAIKLDAASRKIYADLEYARTLALSTAKWYGVAFSINPANTYTVYQTDGATDTTISDPNVLGQDFVVDVNSTFNGVTISAVNISGGNQVEFSPLSVPYNDKSGAAIAAEGIITLSYAGLSKTIRVKPNTGAVYVM